MVLGGKPSTSAFVGLARSEQVIFDHTCSRRDLHLESVHRAGANHPEPSDRGPHGVKWTHHGVKGSHTVVKGLICRCKGRSHRKKS